MDDFTAIVAASAMHLLTVDNYLKILREKVEKRRRRRRVWMIDCHRNRTLQSTEDMFLEMLHEDSGGFSNFCRISPVDFYYILGKIQPLIEKQETKLRLPISAKVRLAVTLRFLATGDSYRSLHILFHISKSIICKIVLEVCQAINAVFKDEIKIPQTPEEWLAIEKEFAGNFSHCVGAIKAKRITLQNYIGRGFQNCANKKSSSIALLAIVDSNYNFIYADISTTRRISDGGLYRDSVFCKKLSTGNLNLPPECPLPGRTINVPYVFVGDEAFDLSKHVMTPYLRNHIDGSSQQIFNRRLSSSCLIVENVFGVLSSVFKIFKKPMKLQPEHAAEITLSCLSLHNFLMKKEISKSIYTPPGSFDVIVDGKVVQEGSWRQDVLETSDITPSPNIDEHVTSTDLEIRDEFANYFCNKTS